MDARTDALMSQAETGKIGLRPSSPSWPVVTRRVRPTTLSRNFLRGRVVGVSQEISVHKDGKQVVETTVEARGGLLDRPVLLVLIVSCVLTVAALIVTYSGA